MTIGENIKRIRKEKGLTQKQLGCLCHMNEVQIRQYELGKANPKIETVIRIASALGVKTVDIMGIAYFDSIIDSNAIKENISQIETIENYFKILGFSLENRVVKWHWEDTNKEFQVVDEVEYVLSKDGYEAAFTQEEFEDLQSDAKEVIEGRFYKKVMQQHNQ